MGTSVNGTAQEVVPFDQLKDAGNQIPDPDDFTGSGRVAWNANDPTRIYFLVEITDDTLQDIHPANSMWWVDDSVEFMFDFDNNVTRDALVQWTLGANGKGPFCSRFFEQYRMDSGKKR